VGALAAFIRSGTHVLDNELHKPRLESKLKLSASLPRNFQRLSRYNARRLCRVYVFLRDAIKFNLVSAKCIVKRERFKTASITSGARLTSWQPNRESES